MVEKGSLKNEIVKNEILEKAQKLFQQYGLKKTTMDEIAAECGKAKSTLYRYYNSKEDVFSAVIDLELRFLRIAVKEKVDKAHTTKDKIIAYFLEFHQEVLNKINLYRIVKHELMSKVLAEECFAKMMNFEISYVTRILEDGHDAGEFVYVPKNEITWYSELMIAAFLGIVRYSIESDESFDQNKLESAAQLLVTRLFR